MMKLWGLDNNRRIRSRDTRTTAPVEDGESSHEDSFPSEALEEEDAVPPPPPPPPPSSLLPPPPDRNRRYGEYDDDDDRSSAPPPPPPPPVPEEDEGSSEYPDDEVAADANVNPASTEAVGMTTVVQFTGGEVVEMTVPPLDLRILERTETAQRERDWEQEQERSSQSSQSSLTASVASECGGGGGEDDDRPGEDSTKAPPPRCRRRKRAIACAGLAVVAAIAIAVGLGLTLGGSRGGKRGGNVDASAGVVPPPPPPSGASPTSSPTEGRSTEPSAAATPTTAPSAPRSAPTGSPTSTAAPSSPKPTIVSTIPPTAAPPKEPPGAAPTTAPPPIAVATSSPTAGPSSAATEEPTLPPTVQSPTRYPSYVPTKSPSADPTTAAPTNIPMTAAPSPNPTSSPATIPPTSSPSAAPLPAEGWDLADEILDRIRPPSFPDRDFDVTRYLTRRGLRGGHDSAEDYTDAFRRAMEDCSSSGGGRVVVPPGTYRTGPIRLRSNVELHLSEGATIEFETDPAAYLPPVLTRFEGIELMNYSPFIYALDEENVAVTGSGGGSVLDGRADMVTWWDWRRRQDASRRRLSRMADDGVPVGDRVFGQNGYLRPSFVQPYRCRNVLIEGVSVRNSPMWTIHPVLSRNVIIRNVTVETGGGVPSLDGIVVESCEDVLVEGCRIDASGEGVSIKSGRNADGRRVDVPSSNVIVRNIEVSGGGAALSIGSDTSGDVRNVFFRDVAVDKSDYAFRIKTNSVRGGGVEGVYLRDVDVDRAREAAVEVDLHYGEGDAGPYDPTVRNVEVRNLTCGRAGRALRLRGYERAPISDVRLVGFRVEDADEDDVVEHVEGLVVEDATRI